MIKVGPFLIGKAPSNGPAGSTYPTQSNASGAATDPAGIMAGIFPGSIGYPPKRGTADMLQAYSTMPWLRSVTDQIAYGVASVEWFLYVATNTTTGKAVKRRLNRLSARGESDPHRVWLKRKKIIKAAIKSGELKEVLVHPVLDLLDSANDFLTGLQTRKLTQIHQDLVGEAFWLLERNAFGMPVAAWPVPPHWIRATPLPNYPYYRVSWRGWQGEIPATEVIHFLEPDPYNPYGRGTGLANSLSDDLETDSYATTFMKTFFYNGARPDIIVSADGLSASETTRMETGWLQKLQGYYRAFRPLFVNRKIEVTELQPNNRNMQLIPIRQFERDTVQQTFGMPPELMGIIENSNRATIESADYLFSRWCVVPRLENMRSTFQERLIPEFDDRLIVEYDSPVSEDADFHLQVMKAAPYAFAADEWRELAGKDAMPDEEGQFYMVPPNVTFTTLPKAILHRSDPNFSEGVDPADIERQDNLERDERRGGIDDSEDDTEDDAVAASAGGGRLKQASRFQGLPPVQVKRASTYANTIAEKHEGAMRRRYLDGIAQLQDGVTLSDLADACDTGRLDRVLDALDFDAWQTSIGATPDAYKAKVLGDAEDESLSLLFDLRVTLNATGDAAADELTQAGFDIAFDETNPAAVDWVMNHGADLVGGISDGTRDAIRTMLADGFNAGIPPRETAQHILGVLGLNDQQASAIINYRATLADGGMAAPAIDNAADAYATKLLRQRATTIAHHETMMASSQGQKTLWKQATDSGLISKKATKKVWIITQDSDVCPSCEDMDGEEVELDEAWDTDEGPCDVPQDIHVGCRCSQGLRFSS